MPLIWAAGLGLLRKAVLSERMRAVTRRIRSQTATHHGRRGRGTARPECLSLAPHGSLTKPVSFWPLLPTLSPAPKLLLNLSHSPGTSKWQDPVLRGPSCPCSVQAFGARAVLGSSQPWKLTHRTLGERPRNPRVRLRTVEVTRNLPLPHPEVAADTPG